VSIKNDLLIDLIPWDKVDSIAVQDNLFAWLTVCRVDVETNHASYKVHSDLFLPHFLRPREGDLHSLLLVGFQFQVELRV